MNKLIGIGKAAKILGVSTQTLRRWEEEKRLIPERTRGLRSRKNKYLIDGLKQAIAPEASQS